MDEVLNSEYKPKDEMKKIMKMYRTSFDRDFNIIKKLRDRNTYSLKMPKDYEKQMTMTQPNLK
jgi:hypothetical protein